MTQDELAEAIGVAPNTIGNYETGATTNLRRIVLNQWALATAVPVEWLRWGTVPRSPDGPEGLGVTESGWIADVVRLHDAA